MLITYTILTLILLTSLALLAAALRGKRTGTEPHCRKCNYDLSGIAQNQTHCPECKHPIYDSKGNATARTGLRRRSRRLLIASLVLLILTSAAITITIRHQLSRVGSWLELAPSSIVLLAAERNVAGAANELTNRLPQHANYRSPSLPPPPAVPLTPEQISRTIDAVIAAQQRPITSWSTEWDRLTSALLHQEDHWSDEQLTEYIRNTTTVSLLAPPRVHAGKPFNIVILLDASHTAPRRPYSHIFSRFSIMTQGLDLYTNEPPQHNTQSRGGSNHWMLYKDMQIRISKTITTEQLGIGPAPGQYQAHARTPVQIARMNQGSFRSTDQWPTAIDIDLPFTINIVDPSEPIIEQRTIAECPTLMQTLRADAIRISGGIDDHEELKISFTNLPHTQPLEASLIGRLEIVIDGQRVPFDNNFATLNDENPSSTERWHQATTQATTQAIATASYNDPSNQTGIKETQDKLNHVVRSIYALYTPEQLEFQVGQGSADKLLLEQHQSPPTEELPTNFDIIYTPDPSLASRLAPTAPAILAEPLIFKAVPIHTMYIPRDPNAAIRPQPLSP